MRVAALAHVVALLLALLVALQVAPLAAPAAAAAENGPAGPTAALLQLINAYRQERDLAPLARVAALDAAALAHTQDMARQDYFGHVSPDGGTLEDRLAAVGYDLRFAGENLAGGQQTPAEVLRAWQDSPSHDEILLTPKATQAGLAFMPNPGGKPIERLWTLVVGQPRD